MSQPYEAVADLGPHGTLVHVKLSTKPMIEMGGPDGDDELAGGMEDFKYNDLTQNPVKYEGKEYKRLLTYTAFDGKTARLHGVLFNDSNDFKNGTYIKIGRLFKDEDVLKNPSIPGSAWSKSALLVQFVDDKSIHHQVAYWNEGNSAHGGIWSGEVPDPAHWTYPVSHDVGPVMKAAPGTFTQELVEPAFAVVAPLSKELAQKTGEKRGIYVMIHGDTPGVGYQVGYRVFSVNNPTGPPIYESKGAFFKPETLV
jgi:hypothetical protein